MRQPLRGVDGQASPDSLLLWQEEPFIWQNFAINTENIYILQCARLIMGRQALTTKTLRVQ